MFSFKIFITYLSGCNTPYMRGRKAARTFSALLLSVAMLLTGICFSAVSEEVPADLTGESNMESIDRI